jgi:hypothetical protein
MTNLEIKDAERFFLSCLLEAAKRRELSTNLVTKDFLDRTHGAIFDAIVKQYRDGKTPDLITIKAEFAEIDAATLAHVTDGSWTYANIKHYEDIIKAESKTRLAMEAFKMALEEMNRPGTDTDTVIRNLLPHLEIVLSTRNETGIKTAAELLKIQFPPINWIVEGLIGEGLTMIVGAPKIGKSWFVLGLALAAAQEGSFLGHLPATAKGVLYLALEDTDRRLQSRLQKMGAMETNNFQIATQWKDGLIGLKNYLSSHKNIDLVIIDTLARFANIEDMNAYAETTNALAGIKRIADDLKIAIVVIHHAGKGKNIKPAKGYDWMESALGSTGLTGTTDSTIYIFRERENGEGQTGNKRAGELRVTGRDSADQKYKLVFDGTIGSWTIDNQASGNQGKSHSSSKSKGGNSHVE